MKIPKIPRLVWIGAAIAAGAVVITKLVGGKASGFLDFLNPGSSNRRGPKCGAGLYSSWKVISSLVDHPELSIGYWQVFDGDAHAEQARFAVQDAGGYEIRIDGENIRVTTPAGGSFSYPRRRNATSLLPPTFR